VHFHIVVTWTPELSTFYCEITEMNLMAIVLVLAILAALAPSSLSSTTEPSFNGTQHDLACYQTIRHTCRLHRSLRVIEYLHGRQLFALHASSAISLSDNRWALDKTSTVMMTVKRSLRFAHVLVRKCTHQAILRYQDRVKQAKNENVQDWLDRRSPLHCELLQSLSNLADSSLKTQNAFDQALIQSRRQEEWEFFVRSFLTTPSILEAVFLPFLGAIMPQASSAPDVILHRERFPSNPTEQRKHPVMQVMMNFLEQHVLDLPSMTFSQIHAALEQALQPLELEPMQIRALATLTTGWVRYVDSYVREHVRERIPGIQQARLFQLPELLSPPTFKVAQQPMSSLVDYLRSEWASLTKDAQNFSNCLILRLDADDHGYRQRFLRLLTLVDRFGYWLSMGYYSKTIPIPIFNNAADLFWLLRRLVLVFTSQGWLHEQRIHTVTQDRWQVNAILAYR
jgi:hypothetical protein